MSVVAGLVVLQRRLVTCWSIVYCNICVRIVRILASCLLAVGNAMRLHSVRGSPSKRFR